MTRSERDEMEGRRCRACYRYLDNHTLDDLRKCARKLDDDDERVKLLRRLS